MTRPDPVTRARQRLRTAIDQACIARGEAQWRNGYRIGAHGRMALGEEEACYRRERVYGRTSTKPSSLWIAPSGPIPPP